MERQLLQWHPAFCAGVQIELEEAGTDLTFIREYQLGRKPKQVDLLVIKKEGTLLLLNRLSEKENLWLRNLTDHLSGEEQAERLVKEYWNHKDNTLYQAVMDIIIRANRKQFEEAKNMCDALRELFAEELKENYQAGEDQGRREFSRLILKLSELGRTDEIIKAAESPEYQEKLMKELGV